MPAAIVTHAATGAGPAIVSRLEDDGFEVLAIATPSGGARPDLGRLVAEAGAATDVDLLVNLMPPSPLGEVVASPVSTFSAALDIGLNSIFSACREAAALAVSTGAQLTIINVVSALGLVGLPKRAAEACSSAGILAASKALAAEWGPLGIRVGTIVAGPTAEWGIDLADMPGRIPLGRFVAPEDVAAAVSYAAGEHAAVLAGHAITIDGGWLAYGYREDT